MPKPTKGPRLGGSPAHQKAMLANLATSLFRHSRITTTQTKAKRLRPFAERLITKARRGDLHARRQVHSVIRDKEIVHLLFAEIGPHFAERPGGYTRITKLGPRKGDNAPMAVIELLAEGTPTKTEPAAKKTSAKKAAAKSAESAADEQESAEAEPGDDRGWRHWGWRHWGWRCRGFCGRGWRCRQERRQGRHVLTADRPPAPEPVDLSDKEGSGLSCVEPAGARPMGDRDAVTVRLRLDLAYDGTDFAGWARQSGQRTIQGVLEQALAVVLRLDQEPATTCAGRTDAGVHARGQVCHVDVPADAYAAVPGRSTRTPAQALLARLMGALPPQVRVRSVATAPDGFDARFSAIWRRYAYRICDDPAAADPIRRHEVLHHGRYLDLEAMNAAAERLLGEHDFAAFCRRREGATTVRRLRELAWRRDDTGLAVGTVIADAFCHSMVRSLVGALIPVGEGQRPVTWPAAVLAGGVRDSAVNVVRARGLTLEEIGYPAADEMATRAQAARQPRAVGTQPRTSRPRSVGGTDG